MTKELKPANRKLSSLTGVAAIFFILSLTGLHSPVFASECYDHWNGDAWHGSAQWAIIMCLDSPIMKKCEVRHHNGEKILDLTEHWGKDRGRVIWTNYEVSSFEYPELLDVVCTAENDLTYTYAVSNTPNDWWDWGGCGPGGDYGGAYCVNDQNENTLHVTTAGSGEGKVTRSPRGINCGSDANGEFCYHAADSQVTLTANPESGIIFSGWSTKECPGSAPCVVTVDQALKITATFLKSGGASARNWLLLNSDKDVPQ